MLRYQYCYESQVDHIAGYGAGASDGPRKRLALQAGTSNDLGRKFGKRSRSVFRTAKANSITSGKRTGASARD
jgi:hypothetical protein